MGGEVDYLDFYQFMHRKDIIQKFTNICCICQKDKNGYYYTTYSKGKKKLSNNSSTDMCVDRCFKRESNFIDEVYYKRIEKLGEFLCDQSENCYHFYHEGCKDKKVGCVFCYFGYSVQNAHTFCKMQYFNFTNVIKIRHYYRIKDLEKHFYKYRFELLQAAYNFIYESKNIDKEAKDTYMDKRYLERNLNDKCLIKYGPHVKTEEIALSEYDNWKKKYEDKLDQLKEAREARKKKEIQEEEEDEDNDEQEEEYEERKNKHKSSNSEHHEMKVRVSFCINCYRGKCVMCGKRWGSDITVQAHESCNKNYRQNSLCGKCKKKCKPADYFYGCWCSDCNHKYYDKCYFCLQK